MSEASRPAAELPAEADLSGKQLGGYRLLRRLGRGAMAEVYLAEQVSLGRQVAVKVLRGSLAIDSTYVQRFHQEARAAAQMVHANIVQIYEVGHAENVHYIAQEYVQGVNLAELLARKGPPSLPRALDIVRQVAAALGKAAERGIVHRDIKPENIMLAASGEVKVADFGLARLYTREDATNLTQVGVTMGTPLYMSPEQVEGRPLDPRSDIYALGITAYQMLAGQPPFRGETALSVAVQHLQTEPERLEHVRPDLPAAVCRIVHKMLAKDPRRRYATPRLLVHDLRAVSIELFGDDPGEDMADWAGDDLISTVEARRQATQRLSAAMRTLSMPAMRRGRLRRWSLLALCVVAGVGVAWATRGGPLIAPVVEDEDIVPRYDTAAAQYIYALTVDNEGGWQSVALYFPNDPTYPRRAQQNLALMYLKEYDFVRAKNVFDEFAALNDVEAEFKAFGLAGQAIVLNREGKFAESADKLAQLWPMKERLDRELVPLVRHTLQSNRESLRESQSLRNWNEWFRQSAPPAPPRSSEPTARRAGTAR